MPTNRAQRRGTADRPKGAHWLRDVELADELNISRAMVHKLRTQGMPSLAIGRTRRYDPDACLDWLRDQEAA